MTTPSTALAVDPTYTVARAEVVGRYILRAVPNGNRWDLFIDGWAFDGSNDRIAGGFWTQTDALDLGHTIVTDRSAA